MKSKKIKLMLVMAVVAVGVGVVALRQEVQAACPDGWTCSDISSAGNCDSCGGRYFCNAPCGVMCYSSGDGATKCCSCEATLCQTSVSCTHCERDAYGACTSCRWCGGTPTNCAFYCPSAYDPCINLCGATPTPAPPPGPVPTSDDPDPRCPNCANLRDFPITGAAVGVTYTFTADFWSPDGDLSGQIFYGGGAYNNIVSGSMAGNSGTLSGTWTPSAQGNYEICCRAWNNARAECRPASLVDGPPRCACDGPVVCQDFEVGPFITPVPTVTPTPATPAPACNPWTSIRINSCTQAKWNASPRDVDCYTNTTGVVLYLSTNDATQMRFKNVPSGDNCSAHTTGYSSWMSYLSNTSWTLSSGNGNRKVCVQFQGPGGTSPFCGALITLDTTPPTCSVSGPNNVCAGTSYQYSVDATDTRLRRAVVAWSSTSGPSWNYPYDGSGDGQGSVSFPSAGSYYVVCAAEDPVNKCSGNPWCPWSPNPPSTLTCSGWVDCTSSDVINVTANVPPSTPTNNSPNGLLCDVASVNYSWSSVSGADEYDIRIDRDYDSWSGNCSALNPGDYCGTVTGTLLNRAVSNCRTYKSWVHAVNTSAPASCQASSASATDAFQVSNTPTVAPSGLAPSGIVCSDLTPTLSWNATADCAPTYRVQVVRNFNGQTIINTTTSNTFYNIPAGQLNWGEDYTWSVRAENGCGIGAWASATFTPLPIPAPPFSCINPTNGSVLACNYQGPHTIDLEWSSSTFATGYDLRFDANFSSWNGNCLSPNPGDHCVDNWPATNYTVTNAFAGMAYQWWVHARNSCGQSPALVCGFNFPACTVIGTVYNDPLAQATITAGPGSMCDLGGASAQQPGNPSTASLNPGGYTSPISAVGTFSIESPPGNYTATIDPNPATAWVCSCPKDPSQPDNCGAYSVVSPSDPAATTLPDAPLKFYVTQLQNAWAQSSGGDVFADGDLSIPIPGTCSGACSTACTPEFSLASAVANQGVVSRSGVNATFIPGSVSAPGWLTRSDYAGPEYNYDFWRKRVDEYVHEDSNCNNLTVRPPDYRDVNAGGLTTTFEFHCSGDARIDGIWNNLADTYTYFIEFDNPSRTLFIDSTFVPQKRITIGGGPFSNNLLTVVTNGNIRIADEMVQMDGIFIADGTISTCENSGCGFDTTNGDVYQLVINGSVVGWDGVNLERDLFIYNACTPAEVFNYIPDWIRRLPAFFSVSKFTWSEVAP